MHLSGGPSQLKGQRLKQQCQKFRAVDISKKKGSKNKQNTVIIIISRAYERKAAIRP